MRARCPHCSNVFNTDRGGIQFCPSCGQQVNVPAPGGESPSVEGPPAAGQAGPPPPPPPPPGTTGGARCGFHPEAPATGTCQRCGTFICGACERRGPDGSLYCPQCHQLLGLTEGAPTAWEDRAQRGAIKGYFQTIKDVCFAPERFWRSVDPTQRWVDALLFAWLTNAIATLVALPITLLQYGSQMEAVSSQPDMPEAFRRVMEAFASPAMMALFVLGTVVLYPVGFLISSGIFHLMMMIVGGNKNGFAATARALGYASAPLLVASIPCVGIIGSVYSLVLWVWGLSATHRTEWWRPLVGLVVFFGLFFCCAIGIAFAIGAAAAGASG